MNRDVLAGQWEQLKGKVVRQWGRITRDEMDQIRGNRDILIGKIQEHYGRSKEEAQDELDRWLEEQDRDGRSS